MRITPSATLIRALHTATTTTSVRASARTPATRTPATLRTLHHTPLRPMPNIPFLSALFGSSTTTMPDQTPYPVQKTDGEWQAVLSPEQFRILRQKGTEAPGSGTYNKHYPTAGAYTCAGCATPLYKANHKFDSGCGWPAFWDAIPGAVGQRGDPSLGMMRTEIVCNHCGGHLGHIFKGERFGNPKDERHCVNSVSINFGEGEGEGGKE